MENDNNVNGNLNDNSVLDALVLTLSLIHI